MTAKQLILRTLNALLAAPGDPETLAMSIGASIAEVEDTVEHLDRRGLVRPHPQQHDASSLTMRGFAAAVAIHAHEHGEVYSADQVTADLTHDRVISRAA